jgi:hypothetical protein
MLVGVSLSGHPVRLVALRHVVPVDVLGARLHVDRADVLCVALPFVAIDHSRTPSPELGSLPSGRRQCRPPSDRAPAPRREAD